ncbi:hypothetical protein ABPG74_008345 [Tetrahymena malaccensis]
MKVLAQFKTIPNYVDFCLPELKSLIAMHNLDWREVFKHEFVQEGQENSATNNDLINTSPYYPYMYHQNKKLNQKKQLLPISASEIRHTSFRRFPFVYLEFPNVEICQQIIQRSILIDVFIEIISEATNYEDIVKFADKEILFKHNQEDQKILFEVDPYNSHLTQQEIIDRIEIITESLNMRGKIDLKNPQKKFWIMERHVDPFTKQTDSSITNTLLDIYFGVEIGRSKSCTRISQKENQTNKYDLRQRAYLGPTSTDNILSFLMCNQGLTRSGDMILDPFVGSGSLIIPPSHFGAICFGGDLDPRVLHGFGVGRLNKKSQFYQKNQEYCQEMKPKIMLNFEQYELNKPNIIRMDCINTNLREVEIFDAIICDPPYGFRAMTRTAGKKEKKRNKKDKQSTNANTQEDEAQNEEDDQQTGSPVLKQTEQAKIVDEISNQMNGLDIEGANTQPKNEEEEKKNNENGEERHSYAPTLTVSVDYIVNGLVRLANRVLTPGGRLVFLYPIEREHYNSTGIEKLNYPNFTLVDYSENPLSEKKSRILVTLQKNKAIKEFLEEEGYKNLDEMKEQNQFQNQTEQQQTQAQ